MENKEIINNLASKHVLNIIFYFIIYINKKLIILNNAINIENNL